MIFVLRTSDMRLRRVIFAQSASDMLPQSGNVKEENRSDFRFYQIRETDKSEFRVMIACGEFRVMIGFAKL